MIAYFNLHLVLKSEKPFHTRRKPNQDSVFIWTETTSRTKDPLFGLTVVRGRLHACNCGLDQTEKSDVLCALPAPLLNYSGSLLEEL